MQRQDQLTQQLRQALPRQELRLHLQPQFDIEGRLRGAEVLLRWNRPGLGEVGPTEFIPIAERTGVIIDLETWVLEEAVEILREWRIYPSTADMRLAVNISGRHIVDDMGDQAHRASLGGGEGLAREERSDEMPSVHTAHDGYGDHRRSNTDAHLGEGERRCRRDHHEIARRHQPHTARAHGTVHRSDRDLIAVHQPVEGSRHRSAVEEG